VLTELNISNNKIGSEGAAALASALRVNRVLKTLDLFNNRIGDEGAKALASALRVNGVLKSLNIHRNNIGDKGAAAIGEALRGNGVLKSIDLRWFGRAHPGRRAARRDGGGHDGHRGRHHAHAAARQLLQAAVSWLWGHERVRQ